MVLLNDIFGNIFHNVDLCAEIKVITGYTSGEFIKYFVDCFKKVELEVYIGMSQLGILKEDHQTYREVMLRNPHVRIYYQIEGLPTHIKLIEVNKLNSSQRYVGSANFSFGGFFHYNELMARIDEEVGQLFSEQRQRSVLASTDEAQQVVRKMDCEAICHQIEEPKLDDTEDLLAWKHQLLRKSIRLRRDSNYFVLFNVPLKNSYSSNLENEKRLSIRLPIGFRTDEYFPIGKTISLHFENQTLECVIGGKFNSELHIKNSSKSMKGMMEMNSQLNFERINENEYSVSFSK